ncbi:hypothetical protein [Hyphobacterium sp.]|jgi:MFS family permease|uniref:hypothetical protein n=1 Tax=Hyphobacterium sp. TaxID=2004662 RepID=UPI003BADAED7
MENSAPQADMHPQSRRLYRIASISVVLFVIVGMLAPPLILTSVEYDTELPGRELLEFIAGHRSWWIWLQTLTMGSMVFLIIPLMALYPALMHGERAVAGIGIVLAISCQVLFMAYFPVVNGLFYLSDRYVEATDPAYRASLVGGAEALVAMNNVYGTSDSIFAISIAIISYAMLNSVFARWIAYLGFFTCLAGLVGAALKGQLGILYLWWWAFFVVWFLAIGVKLAQLGWSRLSNGDIKVR